LKWAAFEEERCNTTKAQEILSTIDNNLPGMALVTIRRAGLARRIGSPEDAAQIYLNASESSDSQADKIFYLIKASKVQAKYVESKEEARETLWKALELDRSNKRVYLQLLDLETRYGEWEEERIEKVFEAVNSTESLSPEFKEHCWQRRIEIFEEECDDVSRILQTYESYQNRHKKTSSSASTTTATKTRKRTNSTRSSESSSKTAKLLSPQGDTAKSNSWDFNNYGNTYRQFDK